MMNVTNNMAGDSLLIYFSVSQSGSRDPPGGPETLFGES
jgi:hypothetical protein